MNKYNTIYDGKDAGYPVDCGQKEAKLGDRFYILQTRIDQNHELVAHLEKILAPLIIQYPQCNDKCGEAACASQLSEFEQIVENQISHLDRINNLLGFLIKEVRI